MQDQTRTPLLFTYNQNDRRANQAEHFYHQRQSMPSIQTGLYMQPNQPQYKTTAIDIAPASFKVQFGPTGVGPLNPKVGPGRPRYWSQIKANWKIWFDRQKFKELSDIDKVKIKIS